MGIKFGGQGAHSISKWGLLNQVTSNGNHSAKHTPRLFSNSQANELRLF